MKLFIFKYLLTFTLMAFSMQMLQGQALGTWRPYMAYQNATMVEVANGYVYALYDGSLLRYKPASGNSLGETKLMSKVDGLNDVFIVRMAYVAAEKILVFVYDNGNIDLYDTTNGNVYNLSYFMNNIDLPDKATNGIDIYDSFAYISINSGVLAIDTKNKVQKNTYNISRKTYSVCLWGDFVYAATEEGIFRASKNGNLLTESNWKSYSPSYSGNPSLIRKITTYKDNFVFYQPGAGIFYQSSPDEPATTLPNAPAYANQLAVFDGQLALIDNSSMYTCEDLNSGVTAMPFPEDISPVYVSHANNSIYWLAVGSAGICSFDKNSGNISAPVTINSPKRNLAFNMTFSQGKLAVVGGGREIGGFFDNPGTLMVMEANGIWINANEDAIFTAVRNDPEISSPDIKVEGFFDVAIDPRDKDHYFVSTCRYGVFELKGDYNQKSINYEKLYNQRNTNGAIKSAAAPSSTNPDRAVWMSGMAYDNKNNLYILNCHTQIPIVVYSSDNKWFNSKQILSGLNFFISQIYVTRTNQKWIVNGEVNSVDNGNIGLLVVDSEDEISYYLNELIDQDDENLKALISKFTCVVEDLNGSIWVGTNTGPIIINNPSAVTNPNTIGYNRCSRMKVPRNDGSDYADYLLEGVEVTTIAIDGANRKWLGTASEGIFLVSPTGDEVIAKFTTSNSPLLSNTINKIVINNETGEVFIATDKGLISYTGLATEGAPDYADVYAFPNPVKPDFTGEVVVTGLIKDSNVKITDLAGNIMYQGTSVGGRFSWNCRNRAGERVKSGVYLVMAATPDGSQGVVTKIVVIK